jgi:hypothetical protein
MAQFIQTSVSEELQANHELWYIIWDKCPKHSLADFLRYSQPPPQYMGIALEKICQFQMQGEASL